METTLKTIFDYLVEQAELHPLVKGATWCTSDALFTDTNRVYPYVTFIYSTGGVSDAGPYFNVSMVIEDLLMNDDTNQNLIYSDTFGIGYSVYKRLQYNLNNLFTTEAANTEPFYNRATDRTSGTIFNFRVNVNQNFNLCEY